MIRTISLNLRIAKNAEQHNQGIREPRIAAFIRDVRPATLGVQESSDFWRDRLDATLEGYVRVQPNQEIPETFKNYVYYDPMAVRLVDGGRFYLSETPNEISKGFGSRFYISCGWGIFEALDTGKQFVHMNCHLDAFLEDARKCEVAVLLERAKSFAKKYPVIITGDFNSRETSVIYETIMGCGFLSDFRNGLPSPEITHTFNGYLSEDDEPQKRYIIDFGFVNDKLSPMSYNVIDKWAGGYMSDHNALVFDFDI